MKCHFHSIVLNPNWHLRCISFNCENKSTNPYHAMIDYACCYDVDVWCTMALKVCYHTDVILLVILLQY